MAPHHTFDCRQYRPGEGRRYTAQWLLSSHCPLCLATIRCCWRRPHQPGKPFSHSLTFRKPAHSRPHLSSGFLALCGHHEASGRHRPTVSSSYNSMTKHVSLAAVSAASGSTSPSTQMWPVLMIFLQQQCSAVYWEEVLRRQRRNCLKWMICRRLLIGHHWFYHQCLLHKSSYHWNKIKKCSWKYNRINLQFPWVISLQTDCD